MRKYFTILILSQISFTFSQVNYCGNCETFRNDNSEDYKKVISINLKEYNGSPIFEDLDENSKSILLDNEINAFYDKQGKIIKYQHYHDLNSQIEFNYNDNGLISSLISRDGLIEKKETFKYDSNLVTQTIFNYDGVQVDRIIKYSLNNNGKTLSKKEYFGNGSLLQEDIFKYDNKNNEIYSNWYGVKSTTSYNYDNNGNIISERKTNNYGKGFTSNFRYDKSGKVIEIIRKSDERGLENKTLYEYENNLLLSIKEIWYSKGKESNVEIKKYEYNSYNMWTKETIIRNEIVAKITIREIKYRE